MQQPEQPEQPEQPTLAQERLVQKEQRQAATARTDAAVLKQRIVVGDRAWLRPEDSVIRTRRRLSDNDVLLSPDRRTSCHRTTA